VLGVARIGHGSRAAEDPGLLAWAAEHGVCFEVCPTSNVFTGAARSYAEHPMKAFLAAGCDVVVGDDDPITIGRRLGDEFRVVAREVGLEPAAVARIHAASIARAFCEPSTRRSLAARAAHLVGSRGAEAAGPG
jgi:adenosine deaminase